MASVSQQNIVELAPNAVRTSTFTSDAIDVRDYEGMAHLILSTSEATAGTNPTLAVKLTHCATPGGSYEDVPGAAFDEVTDAATSTSMISIDLDGMNRYVKLVGTIGGTSTPTFGFGVAMVANLKAGRNASQSIVTEVGE